LVNTQGEQISLETDGVTLVDGTGTGASAYKTLKIDNTAFVGNRTNFRIRFTPDSAMFNTITSNTISSSYIAPTVVNYAGSTTALTIDQNAGTSSAFSVKTSTPVGSQDISSQGTFSITDPSTLGYGTTASASFNGNNQLT
jgi:hypothetical protein